MNDPAETGYGPTARLLHWAVAILLGLAFLSGLAMEEMPRGVLRDAVREAHYSFGMLALALGALRLGHGLLVSPPAPLPGTPGWQHRLTRVAHLGLIGLALAVPASGLADRWARGRPVAVFGGHLLPAPVRMPGGRIWGEAHEALAWGLATLLLLHLLAVAWHALVLRDGMLRRMWGRAGRGG
jgi:cytochrome b561